MKRGDTIKAHRPEEGAKPRSGEWKRKKYKKSKKMS